MVDSLQIKDFEDPTGYITNLAKPHIAEVQKAARIAEAMNNREASEREAEAAAQIAAAQSESKIKQSRARAEAERVDAEAAQAGPLADATARQQVVVQETEIAKLEAARQEQRLNATVYKEADAAAYAKRVQAEATKAADISGAEANARKVELAAQADARKVELAANAEATAAESRARATRTTGEAEAAATTARGTAAASATKAMAVAEADGIQAQGERTVRQPGRGDRATTGRADAGDRPGRRGTIRARRADDGAERRRGREQHARQHHRPGRHAAAAADIGARAPTKRPEPNQNGSRPLAAAPSRTRRMPHATNSDLIGKIGRVTGRIAPGDIGEVMLAVRGGTSAYHAYPADGNTVIPIGDRVLVVEFRPPQSVYVDQLPAFLA